MWDRLHQNSTFDLDRTVYYRCWITVEEVVEQKTKFSLEKLVQHERHQNLVIVLTYIQRIKKDPESTPIRFLYEIMYPPQ